MRSSRSYHDVPGGSGAHRGSPAVWECGVVSPLRVLRIQARAPDAPSLGAVCHAGARLECSRPALRPAPTHIVRRSLEHWLRRIARARGKPPSGGRFLRPASSARTRLGWSAAAGHCLACAAAPRRYGATLPARRARSSKLSRAGRPAHPCGACSPYRPGCQPWFSTATYLSSTSGEQRGLI